MGGWHRAFSLFGDRGKFLISGGNDKMVKVWNWSSYPDAGLSDGNNDILHLNLSVPGKVSFVIQFHWNFWMLVTCSASAKFVYYVIIYTFYLAGQLAMYHHSWYRQPCCVWYIQNRKGLFYNIVLGWMTVVLWMSEYSWRAIKTYNDCLYLCCTYLEDHAPCQEAT